MSRKPKFKTIDSVYLEINNDSNLVSSFLRFLVSKEGSIGHVGCGNYCGCGDYKGYFYAEHKKEIELFFKEYKTKP